MVWWAGEPTSVRTQASTCCHFLVCAASTIKYSIKVVDILKFVRFSSTYATSRCSSNFVIGKIDQRGFSARKQSRNNAIPISRFTWFRGFTMLKQPKREGDALWMGRVHWNGDHFCFYSVPISFRPLEAARSYWLPV